MTPDTSGLQFASLLPASVRTGRAGSCLRTLLGTSRWASTTCSLTWKARATPAGRPLLRLQALARSTDVTGYGSSRLVPTPQARDITGASSERWLNHVTVGERSGNLNDWVMAHSSQGGTKEWLNPQFVTRMMGYPDDWLDIGG